MAQDFPRNGGESPPESAIAPPTMSPSFLKWVAVIIGLIVLLGVLSFGRGVYTDLLWFDSLGFRAIFVKVTVTRISLFAIGAITTAIILSVSLWVAHRYSAGEVNLPIPTEVVPTLRRAVLWGAVIVIVIMSLIFGSVLAARWELFLRFTNSVPFGQIDPVYGQGPGILHLQPAGLLVRAGLDSGSRHRDPAGYGRAELHQLQPSGHELHAERRPPGAHIGYRRP